MIYCINPQCQHRENEDEQEFCANCGTSLLIKNRYRLIQPLRPLDIEHHTEIWIAEDGKTKKVIKILQTDKPKLVALLEREAEALQKLNHPQIPKAKKDSFFTITPQNTSGKLSCLVMEYIEGENLEELIQKKGKISQYKTLNWLRQLLEILEYIHKNSYFHRDIKPSNIILKPNGKLSLIDFGSVRAIRSSFLVKSRLNLADGDLADLFQITKIVSEGFTAPEQVEGKALPQSDFYALGRTFVYLVTGIHPLHLYSPHSNKLIWRHFAKQITKPLADLIDDLMQPEAGLRPQNPKAIAKRLTKWSLLWREWVSWKGLGWSFVFIVSFIFCWQVGIKVMAKHYFNSAEKIEKKSDEKPEENLQQESKNILNKEEKLKKKIEYLEKAVNLNPHNSTYREELAETYHSLGQKYLMAHQLSQARQNFERAIKLNPHNVLYHNDLGLTCKNQYDFECAISQYKQALSLGSNQSETAITHYNLADIYERIGDIDGAIQEYRIVISASNKPDLSIRAANNYSRLQIFYQNEYSLSLDLLKSNFKKLQELLNDLEKKLKQQGENLLNDSEKDLNKLKKEYKRLGYLKSTFLKNIGWAYLQKGDLQQAEKYLQDAIKIEEKKAVKIPIIKLESELKPRAAPYCLLAQVWQNFESEKALEFWEKCRDYENTGDLPEVRTWQLYARQILKSKGV